MYDVTVVTGTRAEYGLLRPVLFKLRAREEVRLRLVVTGSHLAEEFGYTVSEIEADNLPIARRIDILSLEAPAGREGTARRTALALDAFMAELLENRPEVLLVLGDRYEIFAAAQAAALLDIPVAHISGGDVTSGADDDWFRHCITKMAKLHFPSCEAYRRRLLRMGEQPSTVFNVGGLGDENIRSISLLSRETLNERLGCRLPDPYAVVTFHPATQSSMSPEAQADELLAAMDAQPGLFYLCTKANADAGGQVINAKLKAFCDTHENAALYSSLGALRYLSAMKWAALVLGNSSSGVVETPSFGVPTVNVGDRQRGRELSDNVLNCPTERGSISAAIRDVQMPEFRRKASEAISPYNGGDTSGRITGILLEALADGRLQKPKIFYDGEAGA